MQKFVEPSFPAQEPGDETGGILPDDKPASQIDDDDDLLARLKHWHKESNGIISDWRTEAEEDFEFVAGDQWGKDAKEKMIDEGRQPIVFNRIGAIVDAVRGLQINNVEEAIFKPRGQEDTQFAEVGSEIIAALRDDCDANDEESTAFDDCVICGLGVLQVRIDEFGDLKPVLERLSPLEVGWDTSARKRNYVDRRYDWIAREVDIFEARKQYPEFEDADLDASWAKDKAISSSDNSPIYDFDESEEPKQKDLVTMVDFQWWERQDMMRVTDPATGVETDVPLNEAETLMSRVEQLAAITEQQVSMRMRPVTKKIWYHAVVGSKVLYKGELPVQDEQGGRKFLTGKINRANNMPYGLVRNAKDPQRTFNKHITQQIHLINTTAKSGVIHETDAIEDVAEFEENMAKPGARLEVANQALTSGAVQFIQPPQISQALAGMAELSASELNQVTGVNLETLGLLDRDQAGVETHQRKQSTVTNLAWCFDALRIARKDSSKTMILYAMDYTPDDVLARMIPEHMAPILGEMQDANWVPYDIVIDEAPTSPNAKERTWAFMQPLLQLMAAQGLSPETWVEILRYSPMPNSFVESFAKTLLKPPSDEERQKQEQSQALLARMQEAEAGKDEADAIYKLSKASTEAKTAQSKILQNAADALAKTSFEAGKNFPIEQQGVDGGRPNPRD